MKKQDVAKSIPVDLTAFSLRGQEVVLEADVARFFEVSRTELIRAVLDNPARFPPEFLFEVTEEELSGLTPPPVGLGARRRRPRPLAFSGAGVAMMSMLLRHPCAIALSILIIGAVAFEPEEEKSEIEEGRRQPTSEKSHVVTRRARSRGGRRRKTRSAEA